MAKKKITFELYVKQVESKMKERFGLSPNDFDSPDNPSIKSSYEDGETPEEFCDWFENKYL